jgi:hypothetical protein
VCRCRCRSSKVQSSHSTSYPTLFTVLHATCA